MKNSNFISKMKIECFLHFLLVTSLSYCKNPSLENPCDPNHSDYYEILLSKIFSGNTSNHCGVNINKVFAPIFFPSPGHYTEPNFITITTFTPGATIYITTDGTPPSILSTPYLSSSSIWRLAGQRIHAIAIKVGMEDSAISEGTYSILPLKTGQTTSYTVGDDASIGSGLTINYSEPKVDQNFPNDYTTFDQSTGII
ncbi:MAG: chitobiase/beta-hexosaminidase C-terminal domain-containing protein [Leptospira sp.]|uniref:chitobiase/beta-hexosaminidase C-terminal domain-containing protein n=1 Tax=Leptospira sp. TaxID=178 RepID=UPI0025B9781E|nr:chitobiase/beta-hexosaminidase C-terminal domain-containing protein [Leptospira sp.]MBL0956402.1 chitobiase/beta-hexosaminidase C-terminal domain-containing protein [Leptospira sp.]